MGTRFRLGLLALLAAVSGAGAALPMEEVARGLYGSMTAEQRAKGVLEFDDPARKQELFPGGPRAGIQLKDLTAGQRDQAVALLKGFTSAWGAEKAEAIAGQEGKGGLDQYYVVFFGRPGVDKRYGWRIAEHHLTVVDVRVEEGGAVEFGPILLGANPPTLWDEEEDALIDLYKSLSAEERGKASREGKEDSARPIGEAGVRVGELSEGAQKKVAAMFEGRLKFFSDEVRGRVVKMVEAQGGLAAMRVAFWGVADKRCAQGGKWDFKLGGEGFLCDYENTRGHIHLSMKGRLDRVAH